MGRLTRLGSVSGFPSIAVPCGFSTDGLPLSLHLMAAPFQESTLLRAADAYQRATSWHLRRPPLAN
jgi:aspartyl-tRNA(Asn)/glutamyl-tRNA(Gln) amidotransferase subunit A